MTRDDLRQLLSGCPHAEGCEAGCPMAALRRLDAERATSELYRMVERDAREVEQIHLLCVRNRRLRSGATPL